MDPRVNIEQMFGLDVGAGGVQAGVIRCAGGRPRAVMRSVMIAEILSGVKEIMVVHHTRMLSLFLLARV